MPKTLLLFKLSLVVPFTSLVSDDSWILVTGILLFTTIHCCFEYCRTQQLAIWLAAVHGCCFTSLLKTMVDADLFQSSHATVIPCVALSAGEAPQAMIAVVPLH